MRQDISHIQTLSVWVFCIGLTLVSSGWGPALSRFLTPRPSWSVCGQAMCDCRPVALSESMPPDCPLCAAAETPAETCPKETPAAPPRIDPARIALTQSPGDLAVLRIEGVTESLLIGLFLTGGSAVETLMPERGTPVRTDARQRPRSNTLDAPTPPPRA